NMAAAPTVFRLLKNTGLRDRYHIQLDKISFTGEPIDSGTFAYIEEAFGVTPCSMYGTTEVGVLIVNFPGLQGYTVKPAAVGKPAPGWDVAIVDSTGRVLPPYQSGDIAVRRKGQCSPSRTGGTATPRAISTTKAVLMMSSFRRVGR